MDKLVWQLTEEEVLKNLDTKREGLTEREARTRFLKYGANTLAVVKKRNPLILFLGNFKSPLIYILIAAAVISLLLGKLENALVIFVVILINAVIGFLEEIKAEKTIESLKKLSSLTVTVIREGKHRKIESEELVPGDVVLLEEGVKIPADGRLIECSALQVDESVLTGESAYVDKSAAKSASQSSLDVKNLVYLGTSVISGRGKVLVVSTGKNTEFGKITTLVNDEFHSITPLQKKLEKFSKQLGYLVMGICVVVFVIGVLGGQNPLLMFETSVSLAVSAIPEGLPVAITITLVLGMKRMARRKAIIRKLSAVETLGTTTVIASDKTGTLTHNKLMVTEIFDGNMFEVSGEGYGIRGRILRDGIIVEPSEKLKFLLVAATIANDGKIREEKKKVEVFGDPTDCALLVAGEKIGIKKDDIDKKYKRVAELPFSSDRKMILTLNEFGGEKYIFAKGAFEEIVKASIFDHSGKKFKKEELENIKNEEKRMTAGGLRVIAVAYKKTEKNKEKVTREDAKEFVFLGLLGMKDTYRLGAKKAIEICKQAGIRIIMITGDHLDTAKKIGKDLGILQRENQAIESAALEGKSLPHLSKIIAQTTVFARVRPDTKFKIIDALKERGDIVAMTGDGVNDVPALTKADIGVAMGGEGTDAAKEAADMVLVDDNFSTIVTAVEEGRTIFENIRKVLFYLLSTSLGEVLSVLVSLFLGLPLILNPLQILWVNMVTDTAATIPLGMEPMEENHLKKPPRDPKESVLSGRILRKTFLVGVLMAVISIYLFKKYLPLGEDIARTVAFTVIVVTQWFNAFSARSEKSSVFTMNPISNPALLFGVGISVLAQVFIMSTEFTRNIFGLAILPLPVLLESIGFSLLVVLVIEIEKIFIRIKEKKR